MEGLILDLEALIDGLDRCQAQHIPTGDLRIFVATAHLEHALAILRGQ